MLSKCSLSTAHVCGNKTGFLLKCGSVDCWISLLQSEILLFCLEFRIGYCKRLWRAGGVHHHIPCLHIHHTFPITLTLLSCPNSTPDTQLTISQTATRLSEKLQYKWFLTAQDYSCCKHLFIYLFIFWSKIISWVSLMVLFCLACKEIQPNPARGHVHQEGPTHWTFLGYW